MGAGAQKTVFEAVTNQGADAFASRVRGTDAGYAKYMGLNDGKYIDSADVFRVVKAALDGSAIEKVAP